MGWFVEVVVVVWLWGCWLVIRMGRLKKMLFSSLMISMM